jgi:3',5'-cyclic AMP phosphodiesterase CpdA
LQLVHLTDPHFGCEDKEALKAAAKYINEVKPDVVVVTGDISKDGLQHELDAACSWMRALAAPVMLTPGNHDVPYYNPIGRAFYPWRRFNNAAHGVRLAPWHTAEWSIVPINTARGMQLRMNWAQGTIARRQVELAAEELRKTTPGALRIVITHHPLDWPNDAPIHGATIGGVSAQQALIKGGAELFLSGHLHFASARLIGTSALSITSGTLSRRVRHEPCAFTIVRHSEPGIIETDVMHVVQGVVETASKRQFRVSASPLPTGPAEVRAEAWQRCDQTDGV